MINITDKTKCCGCNACGDVCPKGCISYKADIEGFMYPEVNLSSCIDCHLCEKVCPMYKSEDFRNGNVDLPECRAAVSKSIMTRFASTSGGMFTVLASKMYRDGGYVGGAVFDEEWMVSQRISNDKADLEKLRGSKLHQSNSVGFYSRVKDLLVSGEKVLVCGLPCQIAALKSFLNKDYENLITVDLICRGINSPKVFKKWLSFLESECGAKVLRFRVKNKELGWRKLTTKIEFENGKVLYDTSDTNYFTIGYLSTNVYCRPSCYSCKFKGFPRVADITIGDFWGSGKTIGKELDGDLGTSIVLLNNEKGKDYYHSVISKLIDKEVPLSVVVNGNPALISSLPNPRVDREQFYNDLDKNDFKSVANKYIQRSIDSAPPLKAKLKNIASFVYNLTRACGWNACSYIRNLYYNFCKRNIQTNISRGQFLILYKHTILDIDKTARIKVGGKVMIGFKRIKGSKLETRILMERGSNLIFKGSASIIYGADVEVFHDAELLIGNSFHANINFTCICAQEVEIDDYVSLGRDCTIRDNNGGHYVARPGYKNSHPVIIGQHCWICESSTIMPGVKLGPGVIISAKSLVNSSIPAFCMAMGNPAQVIDEDVYYKL
jgi:acetyltransferase-like isoleucine patch superfamily enzyme/coenzyme F420-reducing hydrogenase beta subunit